MAVYLLTRSFVRSLARQLLSLLLQLQFVRRLAPLLSCGRCCCCCCLLMVGRDGAATCSRNRTNSRRQFGLRGCQSASRRRRTWRRCFSSWSFVTISAASVVQRSGAVVPLGWLTLWLSVYCHVVAVWPPPLLLPIAVRCWLFLARGGGRQFDHRLASVPFPRAASQHRLLGQHQPSTAYFSPPVGHDER